MNKIYIGDNEITTGSGGSFDPTVINASVNALETVTDDISTLSNNIKNGTQVLQRVIAAPDGLTNYHASGSLKEVYNVVGQTPAECYLDGTDAPIVFRVGASNIDAFRVKGYKSTDNFSRRIEYYDRFNDSMKDLAEMINYLDASALSFDASVHTLDVSVRALDASVRELATSGGGGGSAPDLTNYATKSDISTFKPISYVNLSTYEDMVEEETIDDDTMYVITDLASSDELSTLVTIDDLNAEKTRINASLNESGDEVITAANSSMNYWKTQNVSQCQSQCTTAKNNAVSAVQSQQTTSVNAVNTAKTTAISEIDTKIAEMKTFEVMTEAEYADITPDANTIYFITD